MTNPTSNFGWVMPTTTDLVTDLPADFAVFGQGVDTTMAVLKGGTTGQVLSKTSATDMAFTWTTPTDQTPLTTKGDLFTYSTTDARLGVGTNGQVLKADSTAATGLAWGAAPSAAKSFALLGTASLTSTITTISGLSGYDDLLVIVPSATATAGGPALRWRINGNTGSVYTQAGSSLVGTAAYAASSSGGATRNASTACDVGNANSTTGGYVVAALSIRGANSAGLKILAGNSGNIDGGGSGSTNFNWQGFYNDTAVVSSISIVTLSSTFSAGSISVYGAV